MMRLRTVRITANPLEHGGAPGHDMFVAASCTTCPEDAGYLMGAIGTPGAMSSTIDHDGMNGCSLGPCGTPGAMTFLVWFALCSVKCGELNGNPWYSMGLISRVL